MALKMSVDEMTSNLLDGWSMTTPLQRHRGLDWYPEAHDFAWIVGHGNVRVGAGLVAALSPNKGWDINRRIAIDAGNGIFAGHVGNALDKARRIWNGEDPKDVLPMGKKTGHFFQNIFDPTNPFWVTIDRHAIRAATVDWDNGAPTIRDTQYPDFVQAFANGADSVGVTPSAFQAILWLWARER